MSLTMQELEQRLLLLEEQMGRLRRKVEGGAAECEAQNKTAEELWHEMGHTGPPPTMDELRAMAEQQRRQTSQKKAHAANGRSAPRKSQSKKDQ